MATATKAEDLAMASSFARLLLALNPAPKVAQSASATIAAADRNPRDAIVLPSYDHMEDKFVICAASHAIIPAGGAGAVTDAPSGAKYLPEFKGLVCRISKISEVGRLASGLRSFV
ncbi:hypothetical protein A4X13_0g8551 [Tilletia indica]|uniref:Coatomer alpha subunit C-terminal domain-containing protein n=1 Tax=Tilletia indica TaxID=43049 RepID=A0A177T6V6_9BASI|nr:hypothetical protein A4X13_0g8551 [Tilletia indica]